MIIATDLGFGYAKILGPNNHRVCFPSVVGEVSAYDLDLFGNGQQQIEVGKQQYLIGDSALRQSMLTVDMQNSDWILSPQWRAMLLYAISETTKARKVEVEIVTGLPFSDYLNKPLRVEFRESLLGTHLIQRSGHTKQKVQINEARILTQNFGPIFHHLKLDQDAMVGVLNIGSHTVEMATVQLNKGGRPEAIRSQCTSDNRGTRTTLPLLHNVLNREKPGIRYSDYELDKGLQAGQVAGVKLASHLNNFIQSVQALVDKNWSSFQVVPLNRLTHFIVTGGGASLVGKKLKVEGPEVIVGDQWDTVLGYEAARKVMK